MKDIEKHVKSIARDLSTGFDGELNEDDEPMTAYDYLTDVLDIEYIIGSDGGYRGARILVAFGGPNIWVDTKSMTVDGSWWMDHFSQSFDDEIGLDDALEDLYACTM